MDNETKEKVSDAWCKGYETAKTGRDFSCNPYSPEDLTAFNAWDEGFMAGEKENRN
jgi:hypothetical protein